MKIGSANLNCTERMYGDYGFEDNIRVNQTPRVKREEPFNHGSNQRGVYVNL